MIKGKNRIGKREIFWFWLFISPWVIGFLALTLGPLIFSVVMSFSRWDIFNTPEFIGFDNYRNLLLNDPVFIKAIKNTLFYAVISVILGMTGSLFLAYFLNNPLKGISFFRIAIYLPSVIPIVAVSMLFRRVLSPAGLLNQFLGVFGIPGPSWLLDKDTVLWAFAIMSLWSIGESTILLLAGMKGIPDEMYEAADMDGASSVTSFIRITVPLLSPIIFFNLVMGIIRGLQTFIQVYIMTADGLGGPDNSSMMIVLYLYRNAFKYFKMGYASGMAWILFGMILLLTALIFRSSGVWVFYESEVKNK